MQARFLTSQNKTMKTIMRKIIMSICLTAITFSSFSQDGNTQDKNAIEELKGKFRRDNIYIGTSLGLGFSTGTFSVGGNPEIGYSIANWLDAGISTNLNYVSFKPQYNYNVRQRSFNYGGGVYLRIYPVRNFFLQVLPEYNWISSNLRDYNYSPAFDYKISQEAPSLLLGAGYGRRVIGSGNFFTAIMFDVGNNPASPYVNYYEDQDGNLDRKSTRLN